MSYHWKLVWFSLALPYKGWQSKAVAKFSVKYGSGIDSIVGPLAADDDISKKVSGEKEPV
jgi:hypothetical protein